MSETAPPVTSPRSWRTLVASLCLWLLVFSPAIFMAFYIQEHAVNVPCLDDWENVPMLKKWHDGTLGWRDLWSLQIQHRPVVPRMFIILLTWLGKGDIRWQNGFAFALNLAASLMVIALMRRTMNPTRWVKPMAFLVNCLLFSPVLFQNFFWATLFWMGMPGMCMVAALLILDMRRPLWLRFSLTVLTAWIATFSFSHGLVMWPVLLGYLLLKVDLAPLRTRLGLAAVWAALAAPTIAVYFHDFRNLSTHAYELAVGEYALGRTVNLLEGDNFMRVIRFGFGLIGNGLARSAFESHELMGRSQWFGGLVVGMVCLLAALCVFTKAGRAAWDRALPWFALAAYGGGMALAVAIGRAHMGEHRCTVPRYFVGTVYVTIAVMVVAFLLLRQWVSGGRIKFLWTQRARYLGVAAIAAIAVWQWQIWQYGLHLAEVWNNARHQARGLLMFVNQDALTPWSINTMDNTHEFCKTQANTLRDLGWLDTPLLASASIHQLKIDKAQLSRGRADVDEAIWRGDELILKGHARFGPERPADVVMITVERDDKIIALGVPRPRPLLRLFNVDYEFTNFLDVPLEDIFLWEAHIPLASMPEGVRSLELWALDSGKPRVARFDRKFIIPSRPQTAP